MRDVDSLHGEILPRNIPRRAGLRASRCVGSDRAADYRDHQQCAAGRAEARTGIAVARYFLAGGVAGVTGAGGGADGASAFHVSRM